jgi:ABC-type transport system substrate-binding protein
MVARTLLVCGAAACVAACDSPARVKPWRHAPDPTAEAEHVPRSRALAAADDGSGGDPRPDRGHTLRIDVDADPGRLSPVVTPSLWARRITLGTVFEPLLRYEPGDASGAGHYAPRLAKEWRVMPDGLEIRIYLEDNVTFHDGAALTTSDVQFTFDTIRDPRTRGVEHLRPLLADVAAIELITAREVRLRLNRPSPWALRALAEIPILPMHLCDANALGAAPLVGTGPWKLASNKNGVVHLARYDHYWGRAPAIPDVEFVYETDAAAALAAAKRGELDIIPALIPAHLQQADAPGLATFARLDLAPPRMRAFDLNPAHAPLDDPRVRHALALLVDRKTIATRVFENLARPVAWPIWPGGIVSGPDVDVPPFDPAAAGKLLDEAGWVDSDKDGFRDQAGKPLRLVLIGAEHPGVKDVAGPVQKTEREMFVDAARRAGVRIEVRTGPPAKRYEDGNWDIVEVELGGMVDSDATALVAGAKHAGSTRIDRALDAIAAAWDPADRWKLSGELAAALDETWPFVGIVADAPRGLVSARVKGVKVWDGWIDLTALSLAGP